MAWLGLEPNSPFGLQTLAKVGKKLSLWQVGHRSNKVWQAKVWQKPNTCQLNCGCQTLAWQTVAGNQTAPKSILKKTRAHIKRPNPNKHELELNSNIWKYCSIKNFSRKKSWVIFGDCFHTHKKVRWMSFERDTVTHRSIDRTATVHALAQDSVSWLWY